MPRHVASDRAPRPGLPAGAPRCAAAARALRHVALLWLCLVAACATEPASCDLVPITEMPLEVKNRLLTVPVGINGQWVRMLVDTGAERTTLSEETVSRLGLERDERFVSASGGVGGVTRSPDATVDSLVMGGVRFPVPRVAVSRFGQGLPADGLLGADILLAVELDIDVPAKRLTLYRVRRLCADVKPPWTEPYVPILGITARKDRMVVPFTLNGVSGSALLDTGAQATAIGMEMAHRVGLTELILANGPTMPIRGVGPNTMTAYLHRFQELRIGPVVHHGIQLPILPTDVGIGDALVGQDFLRERRVWVSFPTRQLFVSELSHERLVRR